MDGQTSIITLDEEGYRYLFMLIKEHIDFQAIKIKKLQRDLDTLSQANEELGKKIEKLTNQAILDSSSKEEG